MHYHWHWFYNFGTGDIGNDGVRGIDVARRGLGVETHPKTIAEYEPRFVAFVAFDGLLGSLKSIMPTVAFVYRGYGHNNPF